MHFAVQRRPQAGLVLVGTGGWENFWADADGAVCASVEAAVMEGQIGSLLHCLQGRFGVGFLVAV